MQKTKLKFKKVTLADTETLAEAFDSYTGRICDYSLGNTIFWRDYYKVSYHLDENGLVLFFGDMDGVGCYSYPVSEKPDAYIEELLEENGAPICLTCLTRKEFEDVSEKYRVLNVMHSADWDDYLYTAEDIVTLKGRKYNGQRNHINKFKRCYPDATFEEISSKNASVAKEFCQRYFHGIGKLTDVSDVEEAQLYEQFDNWDIYRQRGGILSVGGEVIGISVGELVGDTLIIHTEKANTAFDGAYPMLTNCFARKFATNPCCRFINREEDCGEEGLRISKRSYHPVEMIEKYAVVIKKK